MDLATALPGRMIDFLKERDHAYCITICRCVTCDVYSSAFIVTFRIADIDFRRLVGHQPCGHAFEVVLKCNTCVAATPCPFAFGRRALALTCS